MGRPKGSTNKKKKNLESEILNDLENEVQNSELETEKEQNQETETGNFSDITGNQNSGGSIDNSSEQSPNDYLTDLSEIDKIIQKEKPQIEEKRGRKSNAEKHKVALQIPGSLFVRMHVTVGANAISALDTLIAKKNAIPADMLYWDEKVIQEMAPVAEMAMKEMKFEENPVVAFYVMFGAQMISQYASLKALIRQALKENPSLNIQELLKGKK